MLRDPDKRTVQAITRRQAGSIIFAADRSIDCVGRGAVIKTMLPLCCKLRHLRSEVNSSGRPDGLPKAFARLCPGCFAGAVLMKYLQFLAFGLGQEDEGEHSQCARRYADDHD